MLKGASCAAFYCFVDCFFFLVNCVMLLFFSSSYESGISWPFLLLKYKKQEETLTWLQLSDLPEFDVYSFFFSLYHGDGLVVVIMWSFQQCNTEYFAVFMINWNTCLKSSIMCGMRHNFVFCLKRESWKKNLPLGDVSALDRHKPKFVSLSCYPTYKLNLLLFNLHFLSVAP